VKGKVILMKPNWKSWILASVCIVAGITTVEQSAAGIGPGGVGRAGARTGPSNTVGWPLMTKQERIEHQNKIRSMKTYEECNAYVEQHHGQMSERAKEKGRTIPAKPRRDACAWLKK
jgi:hypothetical protein